MGQLFSFKNNDEALKHYFNHYFRHLEVGMVTAITGSPFLKCGQGKCVHPDSEILTPTGSHKIKYLREGDPVLSIDPFGKLSVSQVIKTFERQNIIYEIITPNTKLRCSPEHKFLTFRGWVTAADLNRSDVLVYIDIHEMDRKSGNGTSENGGRGEIDSRNIESVGDSNKQGIFKEVLSEENGNTNSEISGTSMEENEYLENRTIGTGHKLHGWFGRWRRFDHSDYKHKHDQKGNAASNSCDSKYVRRDNEMVNDIYRRTSVPSVAFTQQQASSAVSIDYMRSYESIFIFGENHTILKDKENKCRNLDEVYRISKIRQFGFGIQERGNSFILGTQEVEFVTVPVVEINRTSEKQRTCDIATTFGNYIADGIVVHNSYTGLKLGEMLDPDFGIHKVVYHPKEFLQACDAVEENKYGDRAKPGQVILVDEGEVLAPSSLYFSFTNRAISYVLGTFRYLRAMAIFAAPSFSWFDKRVRVLTSHWGYTTKEYDYKKHKSTVNFKLYRMQTDLYGDKIFYRRITMWNSVLKRVVRFNEFKVSLPSEELCAAYEEKSLEFKRQLRKGVMVEMNKFEKLQQGDEDMRKNLEELAKSVLDIQDARDDLTARGKVSPMNLRAYMTGDDGVCRVSHNESIVLARLVKKLWSGKK